jgi:hypothetical protein
MADDIHNPAGGGTEKKREPGVFDPDYKGRNDPFKRRPGDDDDRWDEPEEEKSTRDT